MKDAKDEAGECGICHKPALYSEGIQVTDGGFAHDLCADRLAEEDEREHQRIIRS